MNGSMTDDQAIFPTFLHLVFINESIWCEKKPPEAAPRLLTFYGISGMFLGPVNALLNGICIYIFNHPRWKKSAMSRMLKGLSIIELGMGISLLLHALIFYYDDLAVMESSVQSERNVTIDMEPDYRTFVTTISSFLLMTMLSRSLLAFQVARNWSVVLLAAYRYDKICRPISASSAFPRERIRYILWAVFILSCCVALPRVFEFGIIVCQYNGKVSREVPLLLRHYLYQILYLGVVMFSVQSGGPVICVCVLSAFVIRIIAKRRKFHKIKEESSAIHLLKKSNMINSENDCQTNIILTNNTTMSSDISKSPKLPTDRINCESENRVETNKTPNCAQLSIPQNERPAPSGDKLIFAMCITFFILETPAFFSKILNPYLEKDYPVFDLSLSVMANLLIYLDSTMNAFVYMASNPTFRMIAKVELLRLRNRLGCHKVKQKSKGPLSNELS